MNSKLQEFNNIIPPRDWYSMLLQIPVCSEFTQPKKKNEVFPLPNGEQIEQHNNFERKRILNLWVCLIYSFFYCSAKLFVPVVYVWK